MIALLSLCVLNTASASEVSVGALINYNDPFLINPSLSLGGGLDIAPGARLGLRGFYAPDLEEEGWRPLTKQLVNTNQISPDLSRMARGGDLTLSIEPLRGAVGGMYSALAMYAGVGLITTVDDLEMLGADETDPQATSTQHQRHPTAVWGLTGDAFFTPDLGVRVRWDHIHYIETINAIHLESKNVAQLGLELVFAPGGNP